MKINGWLWTVAVLWVAPFGCSPVVEESGPSYAELVVIYNAELAALDRLEAKREKLIQEHAASIAPSPGNALSQLEGMLKSAKGLNDGLAQDPDADPNALLDDLAGRSDEAREIAGQLLEGLLGEGAEPTDSDASPKQDSTAAGAEKEPEAEKVSVYEAELADLDAEIAEQQQRVERARQARDDAEVK